ncbi:MAG: hypothetical protein NZ519_04030 [Bacteroidia bacterium]|nr:hypothetical protein [Bacteroidia bacterium]
MEHAVRQYEAQRSTEAKRSAECPDPCVSKGHAQKNKKSFFNLLFFYVFKLY